MVSPPLRRCLLVFFYLKDRYEPEPRGHVAFAFFKGVVAIVPASSPPREGGRSGDGGWRWAGCRRACSRRGDGGAHRGVSKWSVFLAFIYRWNEFDEPLDGVVYGVALALGFATVENVLRACTAHSSPKRKSRE